MDQPREHVDVLILGAGLSGIGVACYLEKHCPSKSYVLLEARGATGGTWDLFRYPGIRSDSDLPTFGYAFRPWDSDKAIADGASIVAYLRQTATEHGVDRHVRLQHKVIRADWSSAEARWTVTVERGDTGERFAMTCTWFFCASGYYRYDEGYTPTFPGRDRFQGQVVHPQHWPDDLDYAGKKVVVIGSGATAVTLVPALAEKAAHVTMLQRTPTYMLPLPTEDKVAKVLRRWLPRERAYDLTRRKNIAVQRAVYGFCRRYPDAAKKAIRWVNGQRLPAGFPVDEHFNPPYQPWDQRLCAVADGDLYRALRSGRAAVVTDTIETFTEKGIRLASGKELEADILVTATGLVLHLFGGIALTVDGAEVRFPERIAYKGAMLDGVPNFLFAIGYTNASWTLKIGLVGEWFCRLLRYVDEKGLATCRPVREPGMATRPLLDFDAGYVKRSIDTLPRQGTEAPWLMPMDFARDQELLGKVEEPHLVFGHAVRTPARASAAAVAAV